MLSSLTYSHIREEMKYSRADWLRQAKSESTTVWESYRKQICTLGQSVLICSKGNDTWIFFYLPPLKFWFWMWCFDVPCWTVWSDIRQHIVILCSLRKRDAHQGAVQSQQTNLISLYIGMEQLSHILPLKNISLVLNTSWEKLSLWYVYTKYTQKLSSAFVSTPLMYYRFFEVKQGHIRRNLFNQYKSKFGYFLHWRRQHQN